MIKNHRYKYPLLQKRHAFRRSPRYTTKRKQSGVSNYLSLASWQSSSLCHRLSIIFQYGETILFDSALSYNQWVLPVIWPGCEMRVPKVISELPTFFIHFCTIQLNLPWPAFATRPVVLTLFSFALYIHYSGPACLAFKLISIRTEASEPSRELNFGKESNIQIWKIPYFWIKCIEIKKPHPNFQFTWVNWFLKPLRKKKQLRSQIFLNCSECNCSVASAIHPGQSNIDPHNLEIEFFALCWEEEFVRVSKYRSRSCYFFILIAEVSEILGSLVSCSIMRTWWSRTCH